MNAKAYHWRHMCALPIEKCQLFVKTEAKVIATIHHRCQPSFSLLAASNTYWHSIQICLFIHSNTYWHTQYSHLYILMEARESPGCCLLQALLPTEDPGATLAPGWRRIWPSGERKLQPRSSSGGQGLDNGGWTTAMWDRRRQRRRPKRWDLWWPRLRFSRVIK